MVATKFVLSSALLAMLVSAAANERRDQYNPVDVIVNGAKSGMINARQQVESLVRGFQSNDGHPTADAVKAFITGLDGQIDNSIGVVADLLSPVTFGASKAVEGAILGPFFQSLTDGTEVAISNLVGMPIDAVLGGSIQSLANNMNKLVGQAQQLQVDQKIVSNMARTQQRLAARVPKGSHHKRDVGVMEGVTSTVNTASQSIDTLVSQLQAQGQHASPAAISAVIAGIDAQIDNAVGNVNNLLSPYANSLSSTVSGVLLNNFFQSITSGSEVVLLNIGTGPADASLSASLNSFARSMKNAADFAGKYNLQDQQTQLININHRIHLLIKQ
ncbi:uncharacterized protein SAPINGB_P005591 [Magnusiomyces paraingens]|uniref:Uncharacterized protein n=1 Tax=Magnusiomyces paraingens TaxID=2606893 RepID=A0A5E8C0I2_9ASCO|nr:uncharacterized protein SAPINGB_P005591 [Saprochaete ingens]VVT57214.1 unnamed protein product [Saprochaete ingens]